VIGVGLAKGGKGLRYNVLGKIAGGWLFAPVVAGVLCYIALFIAQNVFQLEVVRSSSYAISADVRQELARRGIDAQPLAQLDGRKIVGSAQFRQSLQRIQPWSEKQMVHLFDCADLDTLLVDSTLITSQREPLQLTPQQQHAVTLLHGSVFQHRWELDQALVLADSSWREPRDATLRKQITAFRLLRDRLHEIFRVQADNRGR
jgi:PiT family inorganic phosphate transporter